MLQLCMLDFAIILCTTSLPDLFLTSYLLKHDYQAKAFLVVEVYIQGKVAVQLQH